MARSERRRVVVTGLGVVSPIGHGIEAFWAASLAGRNGVGRVTRFDPTGYRSALAAEVREFDPADWIDRKSIARLDPFTHYAIAAAAMAVADAGVGVPLPDPERAGVIVGSGIGGGQAIEEIADTLATRGPRGLGPFLVPRLLVNTAACQVSIRFGLRGPLGAPSVACSTGSGAIGDAARIIERGDADVMLAGAAEACVTPFAFGGFCATRSMSISRDPATASRPFDRERDGFVMGEGAGVAVLEAAEHAAHRGARVYAEVAGYGSTSDAYHLTAPDPQGDGMARAMRAALRDAGLRPADIGYVNAHGTSTVLNDRLESAAIGRVFGGQTAALKVGSTKSMIGHLMAAAGAVEFAVATMAVHTGLVPPTINHRTPDPECPWDYVTAGPATIARRAALSNSFGFGGGNACLVVRAHDAIGTIG